MTETKSIEEKFMLFQLLGQINNFSVTFEDLSDREKKEMKTFNDELSFGKWRAERLWASYVDLDPYHRIAGVIDSLHDVIGKNRIKSVVGEFTRKDGDEKVALLILMDNNGLEILSTSKQAERDELEKRIKEEWKLILQDKHPLSGKI